VLTPWACVGTQTLVDSDYFTIFGVTAPLSGFSLNNPTVSMLAASCAVRMGRLDMPAMPFLPACSGAAAEATASCQAWNDGLL